MKHNFLDDAWLKDQLAEEHLNDDDFSASTMQIIDIQCQHPPWYLYLLSGAIVCSLGYLVINLLLSIFTDVPFEKQAMVDAQWSNLFNGIQFEPICIFAVVLAFALIWSVEEFDLL